jgi:hypothetical protein
MWAEKEYYGKRGAKRHKQRRNKERHNKITKILKRISTFVQSTAHGYANDFPTEVL